MPSVRLLCALSVVAVVAALTAPADAETEYRIQTRRPLAPGVVWEEIRGDSPELFIDVAHIARDAPVKLLPVLSNGQVYENAPGRRTELTTSMCDRAGAIICVNADFPTSLASGDPVGGLVLDGVPLRSPTNLHEQITLLDGGPLATDKLTLDIRIVGIWDASGTAPKPVQQRELVLNVDTINRPTADGVALYSPSWAHSTQTPQDTLETTFSGSVPAIGTVSAVNLGAATGPNSEVPVDGFVLSASGPTRSQFGSVLDKLRDADRVELRVDASLPARISVGGHPVILDRGSRVVQDLDDGKIRNRHPRTLVGWNDAGDIWIVAVDGRRKGHSVGMTIAEAADYLESLGATNAINLDGGGSTTFVTEGPCGSGHCVRNMPSDERERYVSSALAVVSIDATAQTAQDPAPTPTVPATAATDPTTAKANAPITTSASAPKPAPTTAPAANPVPPTTASGDAPTTIEQDGSTTSRDVASATTMATPRGRPPQDQVTFGPLDEAAEGHPSAALALFAMAAIGVAGTGTLTLARRRVRSGPNRTGTNVAP